MLVVKAKEGLKAHSCTLCNSFCVFSAITTLVVFFSQRYCWSCEKSKKKCLSPLLIIYFPLERSLRPAVEFKSDEFQVSPVYTLCTCTNVFEVEIRRNKTGPHIIVYRSMSLDTSTTFIV